MTGVLRPLCIGLLRAYQVMLSPVFYFFGVRCRFEPTCSNYAIDAFRRHSPVKAFGLTARRLARCRPGGGHGHDPVP